MAPQPNFQLSACCTYTGQVQHLASPSVTFYLRFVFKAASHIARMRSDVNFQRFPVETKYYLRHRATSQKVARSFPVGVIGIFSLI